MHTLVSIVGVVFLLALLVGAVIWLGWWLAISLLRQERSALRTERGLLNAEWQALDNTRRVREVFLGARRAMQREAQRQYQSGQES